MGAAAPSFRPVSGSLRAISDASRGLVESESDDETALSIVVWDTGIGIPTDQQDKIFERTYRVQGEANAGKPGSGLGLSISRDLARSIGGEITVSSQPGQGARFTLRLPISSEEATAA